MIWMFTWIAFSLFKVLASIITPYSEKTIGTYLVPPQLEVPNWHLKSSGIPTWKNQQIYQHEELHFRKLIESEGFRNIGSGFIYTN